MKHSEFSFTLLPPHYYLNCWFSVGGRLPLRGFQSVYIIYNTLDLNTQVIYIYCASNIYVKFFLCATNLPRVVIYEIITLVNY